VTPAVLYSCSFVPPEWIAAHGVRPWRTLPASGPASAWLAADMGLCPYARAFAEEARASGAEGLIVSTLCDQMRRVAELLARDSPRPVFLMHLPTTWQSAASRAYYLDELRRLGRLLVQLGGAAPSDERLAAVMLRYDAVRAALRALRGRVSPKRFSEALAEFHATGALTAHAPSAAPPPQGVPIALLGAPMLRNHFWLFDLIEEAGGHVALDATDSGERTLPAPFAADRLRADPLRVLAEAYFGQIPHAFRRPNDALYQWLGRELARSGARGLIVRRYVWCDTWHAEVARLREWAPVPVLDLDVNVDGDAEGRAANRIQAFIEAIQ